MRTSKSAALAAIYIATAAAATAFAGPAHADTPVNLQVTDEVRTQLVQAGASLTRLPASEFSGLRPGRTYYAFQQNGADGTYYAAAALTGAKSEEAAIRLQDQNSYMMFYKGQDPAATWVPIAAGFGPIPAGQQPCPIPQSVRDVWQWPAGKCYPPPAGNQ